MLGFKSVSALVAGAAAGLFLLARRRLRSVRVPTFVLDSSGALVSSRPGEVRATQRATQSTKFNAIYKDGAGLSTTSGPLCFDVKIVEGSEVWVGLTDAAHFGDGWKCKSFSYGGNLSDGGALLRQNFGPPLQAGDVLSVRAELLRQPSDGVYTLAIWFAHNGVGLGQAFKLEDLSDTVLGPLFPLISFSSGPATAVITRRWWAPRWRFEQPEASARESMEGDWEADASTVLGAASTLPPVIFTVDTRRWVLSGRAGANSFAVQLSASAPHAAQGGVRATMMMPPPELAALDRATGNVLGAVDGVALDGANALRLSLGAAGALRLRPHFAAKTAVNTNEVMWLSKR